uniref:Uncharacterized protein n=1 Tax=Leersia perrieri TaxID=77586 RepID=A0A0D9VXI4_9ORYZ
MAAATPFFSLLRLLLPLLAGNLPAAVLGKQARVEMTDCGGDDPQLYIAGFANGKGQWFPLQGNIGYGADDALAGLGRLFEKVMLGDDGVSGSRRRRRRAASATATGYSDL